MEVHLSEEFETGYIAGHNNVKQKLTKLLLISTLVLLCVFIFDISTCEISERTYCTFSIWVTFLASNIAVQKKYQKERNPPAYDQKRILTTPEKTLYAESLTTAESLATVE